MGEKDFNPRCTQIAFSTSADLFMSLLNRQQTNSTTIRLFVKEINKHIHIIENTV